MGGVLLIVLCDNLKRGGVITSGPNKLIVLIAITQQAGHQSTGKKYKDLAEALGVDKNVIHNANLNL